ncbi:hypothetical protein [Streptomyces sp. URMC 123]|uniref:hypothetical protein n=1 Tax=Streptomyces sp. URMC 123 TaxID=3423403 RepID=UPI003F195C49
MTPYSLAFYLDVVTTGTVLGARPTDSPDRVTEVLGPDFAENPFAYSLCRDYGMAEFFWDRASADHPWEGHHFTLRVHQLARLGSASVNGAIRAAYGRFDRRLRFAKLHRLLERRGVRLLEVPHPQAPHYRTYWQPRSLVSITVIGAREDFITPDDLRVGDVHSISGPVISDELERLASRTR